MIWLLYSISFVLLIAGQVKRMSILMNSLRPDPEIDLKVLFTIHGLASICAFAFHVLFSIMHMPWMNMTCAISFAIMSFVPFYAYVVRGYFKK